MVTSTRDGTSSDRLYKGKSTDTKPIVGVKNGDMFYEMDTAEVYMFDADSQQWLKQ